MNEKFCEACGGVLNGEYENCPYCGHSLRATVPRKWILLFFVVGVVLGLVLLNLDRALAPSWLEPQWTTQGDEPAGSEVSPDETVDSAPRRKPQRTPAGQPTSRQQAATEPRIEPRYCDLDKARAVREKARSLATLSEEGGQLLLRLGREWEFYSPGHRRGFVEAVAESDLCLQQGRGRTIRFSYHGKEVAIVTAEGAVEMK